MLLLLRNHQSAATPEPEPEPSPAGSGVRTRERFPLRTVTGNTHRLKLVADLGGITAHANTRLELADEDIIELL